MKKSLNSRTNLGQFAYIDTPFTHQANNIHNYTSWDIYLKFETCFLKIHKLWRDDKFKTFWLDSYFKKSFVAKKHKKILKLSKKAKDNFLKLFLLKSYSMTLYYNTQLTILHLARSGLQTVETESLRVTWAKILNKTFLLQNEYFYVISLYCGGVETHFFSNTTSNICQLKFV